MMKTSSYSGFLSLGVVGAALILGPSLQARDGGPGVTGTDYIGLDGSAEPLKGSFNADLGKVRILMLVAPT
jgi:hypothetical protein